MEIGSVVRRVLPLSGGQKSKKSSLYLPGIRRKYERYEKRKREACIYLLVVQRKLVQVPIAFQPFTLAYLLATPIRFVAEQSRAKQSSPIHPSGEKKKKRKDPSDVETSSIAGLCHVAQQPSHRSKWKMENGLLISDR